MLGIMKSFTVSIPKILSFRRRVITWYRAHGRTLPWRATHDPYKILVSEIMLQQTQVDRVKDRYRLWLKQFPTVQALAQASQGEVLKAWAGLGYNRRALALHDIAQRIVREFNGEFPHSVEKLMELKGIGRYTASAIAAFAYRQPVPVVDTNIKRILGRVFFGFRRLAELRDTDEPFWILKEKIVPNGSTAYDLNQGLMDFGATVCTAKQPSCQICPLQSICASYPEILDASADQLRVKTKRSEPTYFGYPRRIWRGKILTYVHSLPANHSTVTTQTIGKHIQADWTPQRGAWLNQVLETMEKDRLIKIIRPSTRPKIKRPRNSSNTNWKIQTVQ